MRDRSECNCAEQSIFESTTETRTMKHNCDARHAAIEAAYSRDDHATAIALARSLADQGDVVAQTMLGSIYLRGKGFPRITLTLRFGSARLPIRELCAHRLTSGVCTPTGRASRKTMPRPSNGSTNPQIKVLLKGRPIWGAVMLRAKASRVTLQKPLNGSARPPTKGKPARRLGLGICTPRVKASQRIMRVRQMVSQSRQTGRCARTNIPWRDV
jgi:hypothetical protein